MAHQQQLRKMMVSAMNAGEFDGILPGTTVPAPA
jgi:hypothetical protein